MCLQERGFRERATETGRGITFERTYQRPEKPNQNNNSPGRRVELFPALTKGWKEFVFQEAE